MRATADNAGRLPTRNRDARTARLDRVAAGAAERLLTPGSAPRRRFELSDEDLMRRIQDDDIQAFEELYDRCSAKAFGLTRLMCGSPQRAEDALQEGFLTVWRNRETYDPARGSPRAWLMTIIRHRCIDTIRRERRADSQRESDIELEHFPAPGSVAEDAANHDATNRIQALLLGLPLTQREAIALAYFGELTHTEIAARLQIPTGTIKGRIRLGLHKIRAELNPPSSPEPAPAKSRRRATKTSRHPPPAPRKKTRI